LNHHKLGISIISKLFKLFAIHSIHVILLTFKVWEKTVG
jgi:hypothetical protein